MKHQPNSTFKDDITPAQEPGESDEWVYVPTHPDNRLRARLARGYQEFVEYNDFLGGLVITCSPSRARAVVRKPGGIRGRGLRC